MLSAIIWKFLFFTFWFPCHTLLPSFGELPSYILLRSRMSNVKETQLGVVPPFVCAPTQEVKCLAFVLPLSANRLRGSGLLTATMGHTYLRGLFCLHPLSWATLQNSLSSWLANYLFGSALADYICSTCFYSDPHNRQYVRMCVFMYALLVAVVGGCCEWPRWMAHVREYPLWVASVSGS